MREMWIGSGWKMHKTLGEAQGFAETLRRFVETRGTRMHLFVVPPFTALGTVAHVLKESGVLVGAQNIHWEDSGQFTGEVSPVMVKDCGAWLVELGHSERREAFAETDYTVNRKVLAALRNGLRPLICVGESAIEKEFGVAEESVARQVKIALKGVCREDVGSIMVAYEPVWAIGTNGTPAEPEYANHMHGLIRGVITADYGLQASAPVPILYGGSVNAENAAAFTAQRDIDGLFVGRAAWEIEGFIEIIQLVERSLA